MVKTEEMLKDILNRIKSMEDQLNSLNFTVVQSFGDGNMPEQTTKKASTTSTGTSQQVEVDLKPLENRLDVISSKLSTLTSDDKLDSIDRNLNSLTSGKIAKAEELINRASILLEQGLKLTELETAMLEIRNQLEQLLVEKSTRSEELPT